MSEQSQSVYLPESPYPGIDPYSYADRNVFFARKTEVRSLVRLIVQFRGVLLYSDSGTGKSSLINAGLIPLAIEEGFQPERIRVQPRRGEECVVERMSSRVDGDRVFLPSVFAVHGEQERVVLSVQTFLETVRASAGATRPLLIFDQFEEWITLFEEDSAGPTEDAPHTSQDKIRDTIVSLINDSLLPVKVLIVFREDYLAKLTPIFQRCPTLTDQYMRLTPLRGEQVYHAIRGPFEQYPGRYQPEIAPALARQIQSQFEERSAGSAIRLTEVQIVCHKLFETKKEGIDPERFFNEQHGVQGILERYLEDRIQTLQVEQRDPAVGLLTRMVTPAGTRNVISRDDLLRRVELEEGIAAGVLGGALDSLEDKTKLVRRERRRDVYYYEIASEFLVGWIRRKAQERQRLADQKKIEEAQRRRRNRWLQVTVGAVFLLSIISAWAYSAYSLWVQKRPWGYTTNLSTGTTYALKAEQATIGRSTKEFTNTISLSPQTISRMHLMILRGLVAIDLRSLNGTTVNARFLPYGSSRVLKDGDIVVLAGIAPFRIHAKGYSILSLTTAPISDSSPPSGWGILIDGNSKTVLSLAEKRLSPSEYFLSLDKDDRIILRERETDDTLLTIRRYPDGIVSIQDRNDGVDLLATMKVGDYDYREYKIPSGREFFGFTTNQESHDLFEVAYEYKGVPFQLVLVVPDLEPRKSISRR
jgi:conflict system STAND superfamily ATPase/FHA domain-containing protein